MSRTVVISSEWTDPERDLLVDLISRNIRQLSGLSATELILWVTFETNVSIPPILAMYKHKILCLKGLPSESLENAREYFAPELAQLRRKVHVSKSWLPEERQAVSALLWEHWNELEAAEREWRKLIEWEAPCFAENKAKFALIREHLELVLEGDVFAVESAREALSEYVF